MTVIGFTGTQDGMTLWQRHNVNKLLVNLNPTEVHHGDCIGADAQFHTICKGLHIQVVGHPGKNERGQSPKRAYCDLDEEKPALPYLDRNDNIVKACDVLIAAPKGDQEEKRSGTWYTIRRAFRMNRTIYILFPHGRVEIIGDAIEGNSDNHH